MSISDCIMFISMVFMFVGAIDKVIGNKYGYGEEFENGLNAIGPLVLSAAAVMAIAPSLANVLVPFIHPVFQKVGLDSSLLPALFLCSDMGGYSLSMLLADDVSLGYYNGLVVSAIIGATFTFTVPVALAILNPKEKDVLAAGVLTGLATAPIGCLVGGFAMNLTPYKINILLILKNLLPIIIFSCLIIFCLKMFPNVSIKVFGILGIIVSTSITILTAIAIFQEVTKMGIPLFDSILVKDPITGLTGFESGLLTCSKIGIVLAGAFPMVKWISYILHKPLLFLGEKLKINHESVVGFLAGATNYAAGFSKFSKMDIKGKYLNASFIVGGGCVFGDLLGFTAGINSALLVPMILGKLTAGICAVILANIFSSKLLHERNEVKHHLK